jgi:hypothetical protein
MGTSCGLTARCRQGFVVERTALINRLRGLLSEFGVVLPLRSVTVRRQASHAAQALPELARSGIGELLDELRHLDERIERYDGEIHARAKLSEPARRLMQVRGSLLVQGARSVLQNCARAPGSALALGARAAAAQRMLALPLRRGLCLAGVATTNGGLQVSAKVRAFQVARRRTGSGLP